MAEVLPRPSSDILRQASSAIGKIDLWGRRGVTMVSADEIEAMALLLAALGLVATQPGKPFPETLIIPPSKED